MSSILKESGLVGLVGLVLFLIVAKIRISGISGISLLFECERFRNAAREERALEHENVAGEER